MKNHLITIGFIATCFFAIGSCKKAGLSGDSTLVIFPKHHGTAIPNQTLYRDSVFVTFNAKDLPSDPTHNYDALFVGEPGEDHVRCTGLHTGTYFIYVTGFDSSIGQRVTGGASIKIKYKERKEEVNFEVSVVE